jgi:hypothetical protein
VEHALSFFESKKCSFILCVTRSGGAPLRAARDHSKEQWQKSPDEWAKSGEADAMAQEASNLALAKKLLHRLKQACAAA